MTAILWVIAVIISLFIIFGLWRCVAINAPMTEEDKLRAFRDDCVEFDKYMAERKQKKEAENHAE